jgi:hypothetical protein
VESLFFCNLDCEEYIADDFGVDSVSTMASPRFMIFFWAKALSLDGIGYAHGCRSNLVAPLWVA